MILLYYDESGDDGFPKYSSKLFVLTVNYIQDSLWRDAFNEVKDFRKWVYSEIGLPKSKEIHVKEFLLYKNPYRLLNIDDKKRIEVIYRYCECVAKLPIKVVNVVINKTIIRKETYQVLDNALTYSVQRVTNSIQNPNEKIIIISDEGRIPKMRKTTRRLQIFNPIPSRFSAGIVAQRPIDRLIEDPLPKESQHSYFIQISDLIAYLVYNHMLEILSIGESNNRLPIGHTAINGLLDIISPVLNFKASMTNKYGFGIVCYPLN